MGSEPAAREAAAPSPGADGDPPLPPDAVEVGRIVGAWGVQGGLKVKPFAADPQALFSSKRWFLAAPDAPGPAPRGGRTPLPHLLRIVSAREQGDHVVATVHDVGDRDAAEALKGARVLVARSSFPTPDDGEYYWVDLIGLSVVNRRGLTLGRVDGLLETGPHCVLSIVGGADGGAGARPEGLPTLIPFVDAYVDRVDLDARRIEVDWDLDDEAV